MIRDIQEIFPNHYEEMPDIGRKGSLMLSERQLRAYLNRIGMGTVPSAPECSVELLDELIMAHLLAIPFSTLSIREPQQTPKLEIDALFGKLVENRHGGYCFELNKLFESLLATLGFDVRPCLCRSVRGRDPKPVNHRGELVTIGGALRYVDVGFGGPLSCKSVPLDDGEPVFDGMHTFIPVREEEDGWWRIDRYTGGVADIYGDDGEARRQTELLVCTGPAPEASFDALNRELSRPGSPFFDHDTVNLRTRDGYLAYRDGVGVLRNAEGKHAVDFRAGGDPSELWFNGRIIEYVSDGEVD